ncbi:alpha/beta hydrolase [Actinoplanes sp. Pm04-4]|uniref:Alpha/beta hydrolase n=1 Tax=Paractinoplanes pyxinae TaxID=2997416 RepID=A0ABT4ATU7_9ACTN|nr:alpha/beta hydrolase [Actinoplanes pyxinae]MCY1136830.1 alpha/beta hydrolase [Actinoplanes pyxinae]
MDQITTRGLTFDVYAAGPPDGEPVLLLHGFPQDRREFAGLLPKLHKAGMRTYVYDQRGYAPGARPADVGDYRLTEAVADAVAVLDALGLNAVHVVGHDWGAQVGWRLAADHPERVLSLTAVSLPHPEALARAVKKHGVQRLRLAYTALLRSRAGEGLARLLMQQLLRRLGVRGLPYVRAMRDRRRLTAALNWYRALDDPRVPVIGPVGVPTTFVWGTRDFVVGRAAAESTADLVDEDYRFVTLRRVGHWVPEEAPGPLLEAIVDRVRKGAREEHRGGLASGR